MSVYFSLLAMCCLRVLPLRDVFQEIVGRVMAMLNRSSFHCLSILLNATKRKENVWYEQPRS